MTNPLIPFLVRHCLAGLAAGVVFLSGLLGLDVANLRTLIAAEPSWWLPLGLLTFGVSVTFGSAAMGAGIMSLGRSQPPSGRRGSSLHAAHRVGLWHPGRPGLRPAPARSRP